MTFKDSPITRRILWFGSNRIGQFKSPIILAKALAIHSAESPFPRLPIIDESRSQEFKSKTSELAMRIFHKDLYINLSGDETVHGLKNDYGTELNGKCLMLDEGNLLFKAMHKRSSIRWQSAIAQLYTRELYVFSTEQNRFELKGKISFVINIVTPAWKRHKDEIFETTLGDRALVLHSWLTKEEHYACKKRFKDTMWMKPPLFIGERYSEPIRNLDEFDGQLKAYAEDYATLAERSPAECLDLVTAIASENARLNQRNYLTSDDMTVVRILRPYNFYPLSTVGIKILAYLKEGRRHTDICHLLGKEPSRFLPLISYYKKKYLERGALDLDET